MTVRARVRVTIRVRVSVTVSADLGRARSLDAGELLVEEGLHGEVESPPLLGLGERARLVERLHHAHREL